jgi:hypothetical protein
MGKMEENVWLNARNVEQKLLRLKNAGLWLVAQTNLAKK